MRTFFMKMSHALHILIKIVSLAILVTNCACQPSKNKENNDEINSLQRSALMRQSEIIKNELEKSLKKELEIELKSYIDEKITASTKINNKDNSITSLTTIPATPPTRNTNNPSEMKIAEQEPEPLQPSQTVEKDEQGMKILRHELSTGIQRRLPIETKTAFPNSTPEIFCFVEVASIYDPERTLTLKWIHSTGVTQSYDLTIGQSPAWRTWSKLNLTSAMTGRWNCEVFNEDGTLLSVAHFHIFDNNNY